VSASTSLTERYAPLIQTDGELARRELEAVVRAEPSSVEALGLLALANLRCLDFTRSAEAHRALLAHDPQNAESLMGLTACLMNLGEDEAALEAARAAFEATNLVNALLLVAQLLHRLGRFSEAIPIYEHLLASRIPKVNRVHALRGATHVLRDAGEPLRAEVFARELVRLFLAQPRLISSSIVQREQSTAFHEWYPLATKPALASLLRRGLAAEPGARTPETFVLPGDRESLAAYVAAQPAGALYIAKPGHGSGGRGIRVTAHPEALLDERDVVVQRYIDRPYLVDGRKGHLRIYALITSADPPRAYIYPQGIVRFAPVLYDPSPEKLADVAMHVTNTALHKGRADLVVSDDPNLEDVGAIWSLSAYLKRMQADAGHDPQAVFAEIRDLVAWTLRQVRREGILHRQARSAPRRAYGAKLLGFDILLDAEAKPWLIELQAVPAAVGAPLVEKINGELFIQMMRMTTTFLLADGAGEAEAAALSPQVMAERERDIEQANRGGFQPLDLG
jgi:tetratricopeptide (TPR) repeat protein